MKQKIHIAYHFEQREEYPFKILHLFIFFFLLSLTVNAQQPYEWQWAMKGGGSLGGTGSGTDDERIYDIKVGKDMFPKV